MSKPGFTLTDAAFAKLIGSFRMIQVQVDGAPREELVEKIDTDKDVWIVRSERNLQSVLGGDEDIARTTVTETKEAYVRTRRWWQSPVKQTVLIAVDNTPGVGEVTTEYLGPEAKVPEEFR